MNFVKKIGFSAKILKKLRLNSTFRYYYKNFDSQDCSADTNQFERNSFISDIKLLNIRYLLLKLFLVYCSFTSDNEIIIDPRVQ